MSAAADKVWARLGQMFGARWYDNYGKAANDEWKIAVDALRPDQVNGAIANIRNSARAHPPTLPEFVGLAKGFALPEQRSTQSKPVEICRYRQYGNRALLAWLAKYGPVGESTLPLLVAAKNHLCDAYASICSEEPQACEELKGKLMQAFERVVLEGAA